MSHFLPGFPPTKIRFYNTKRDELKKVLNAMRLGYAQIAAPCKKILTIFGGKKNEKSNLVVYDSIDGDLRY